MTDNIKDSSSGPHTATEDQAAVMLAGPDAWFANGACWDINGGLFMR